MGVVTRTVVLGGTVAIAVVANATIRLDGLTAIARQEIPSGMADVYKSAATRCVGLPWQVLAAIGWVESRHAGGLADPTTGDLPTPVVGAPLDGADGSTAVHDPSQPDGWARPLGPMGLLPAAWERHATIGLGRPPGASPSVQNVRDAASATADELCNGSPVLVDLNRSIRSHTPRPSHVMAVLLKAARYGSGDVPDVATLVTAASAGEGSTSVAGAPAAPVQSVISAALAMLGTPYVWGAESPSSGFDCSGLVWWAYKQAGLNVARTTAGQINEGVAVSSGETLRPGDLLFTRGGRPTHDRGHVSIYAGKGLEIIAPRSGKSVTVQRVDLDRVQAVRRILGTT